jgi:starch phosphorylase
MPDVTLENHALFAVPIPEALHPLREIAFNFWWTWNPDAFALLGRVDPDAWERTRHNPVKTLMEADAGKLAAAAADAQFVAEAGAIVARMRSEIAAVTRFHPQSGTEEAAPAGFRVGYFCAEFGLSECFGIYCGGLGLLSGDHLKSAAQLKLPLVAVGLAYRRGYFQQRIDGAGVQHEELPDLGWDRLPVRRVVGSDGQWLKVPVEFPGRRLVAGLWRTDVGAVPLYLLDTNLNENTPTDREITSNLYLGDARRRIEQELVLGIGGVRALQAVGERPTVFHLNEGHSAFLTLERIRQIRGAHPTLSFDQAREGAAAAHCFTTHTPLPAGNDRFHPDLVTEYLSWILPGVGLDIEGLLALGRERVEEKQELFSMACLALRASKWANGVSRLHGHVSRQMWARMWPGTPVNDVPIGHVTNGVHAGSWIGPEMRGVYEKHLGDRVRMYPDDPHAWAGIEKAGDAELWRARNAGRARLVKFARARLQASARARGADGAEIDRLGTVLDENVLTIGFARRFAGYKRATLLFRDAKRLRGLLLGDTPIQLVIAGKAHPGDGAGRQFIQAIVEFAKREGVWHRVVFLEDYGIDVARAMVQGCDVWFNNPVRPLEASGTSGMKAALNGTLNASILDGWWDEGYDPEWGFAIGGRWAPPGESTEQRDAREADYAYDIIANGLVPAFYTRESGGGTPGSPKGWLKMVRACVREMGPRFNTHRMVAEYAGEFYFPAHRAAGPLAADGFKLAAAMADRIGTYREGFKSVHIEHAGAQAAPANTTSPDMSLSCWAEVFLNGLKPDEVSVQLSPDAIAGPDDMPLGGAFTLSYERDLGGGRHRYSGTLLTTTAKLKASPTMAVRVIPHDERLITPFVPGLLVAMHVNVVYAR